MATQQIHQTVTTQNQLPEWYQQYLQQTMGRALGAADEPYQPYGGATVAGLTPAQLQAYDQVRAIQGGATPWLLEGTDMTRAAGAGQSGAAGAGSFDAATGLFNRGAGYDTAGISSPFVNQGIGLAEQAGAGNALAAAYPYVDQSTMPMGLSAASPYLAAAGTSFPQAASAYMSPYTSSVLDQIAARGGRNLSENILPAISDDFIRAGQYGSTRQRDLVGRAARDTQEAILGEQARALESGYSTAGQLYGQDAARMAGLAGTAGGLGTAQQQLLQSAGLGLGNLSSADLNRLLGAGQTIGQLGLGQAGMAAGDASRMIQAGQGLSGIGQSQIQAAQNDYARQLAAGQQMAGIGQLGQNMALQGSAALEGVGAAQQGQDQRSLDAAYQEYLRQQNYPWQTIGNLSNVVQGLPVNMSTSQQSQSTQPGPSTLGQLGGIGMGIAGLAGSGIFGKAKGGAVKARPYGRRTGIGSLARAA